MPLTREAIRQATLAKGKVPVDEWGHGETVTVRAVMGAELAYAEQLGTMAELRAYLTSRCTLHEDGSPLFMSDDELWLLSGPAGPVDRIAAKAMELAGVGGVNDVPPAPAPVHQLRRGAVHPLADARKARAEARDHGRLVTSP